MALPTFGNLKLSIFLDNLFFIPRYQRDYTWDTGEFTDLINDIESTFHNNTQRSHFFGQIVLKEEYPRTLEDLNVLPQTYRNHISRIGLEAFQQDVQRNKIYQIIDGQQRITTVFIFLKALLTHFNNVLSSAHVDLTTQEGLDLVTTIVTEKNEIIQLIGGQINRTTHIRHLCVGKNNDDWFEENILRRDEPPRFATRGPIPRAYKLYSKAYWFFFEHLRRKIDAIENSSEKIEILKKYKDAVLVNFNVLFLSTSSLQAAFTMFETLNARGVNLAAADLIKNHILSLLPENQIDYASDIWDCMTNEELRNIEPTKYLRAFYNAKREGNEVVREKELYGVISSNLNNADSCLDFLSNIVQYSRVFHDVVLPKEIPLFFNGENPIERKTDERIRKSLQYLQLLGVSSFSPIVLSLCMKDYPKESIKRILYMIEIYVFRNLTVGNQNPNETEKLFIKVAREIFRSDVLDKTETENYICNEIKEKLITEDIFKTQLKRGFDESKNCIRYFFARLHEAKNPNSSVVTDWTQTHIEHIMPQTIITNTGDTAIGWSHINENEHSEYLWNIGNLTLLNQKPNEEVQNGPFPEKINAYRRDSNLYSTGEIIDDYQTVDQWTVNLIEERNNKLIADAMNIWAGYFSLLNV